MFKWLFKSSHNKVLAYSLYTRLVEQSREAVFYETYHVCDTLDGRFDMIVLHMFLFLRRLEREGPETQDIRQMMMEAIIADMDRAIREIGVGDMGVGKQVKKLGAGLLGRIDAYGKALDAADKEAQLEAALIRNLYRDAEEHSAGMMVVYMMNLDSWLQSKTKEDLLVENLDMPSVENLLGKEA
ncbi:ubiquinol-cytochrome c chaperone [Kordiimonas sediminis]|uniref:Ubiquinol-cytochrome c chaperone n=1 Tax=Kordiimonas sediminis TaxID=1735581 RepID=A0A919AVV6_9PROT|nr:ubiquinol-cytochrome C chaperone family protein [Kordiimonas sediminis]GHF29059.1 ubiquinol-cytochrome c chaperone [Kordiimonas sediminis]